MENRKELEDAGFPVVEYDNYHGIARDLRELGHKRNDGELLKVADRLDALTIKMGSTWRQQIKRQRESGAFMRQALNGAYEALSRN